MRGIHLWFYYRDVSFAPNTYNFYIELTIHLYNNRINRLTKISAIINRTITISSSPAGKAVTREFIVTLYNTLASILTRVGIANA